MSTYLFTSEEYITYLVNSFISKIQITCFIESWVLLLYKYIDREDAHIMSLKRDGNICSLPFLKSNFSGWRLSRIT